MQYIPKVIHLIWVGRNPYSPIVEKCIESWKKYCPDYEIKLWNEDNFDINSNIFVKEAYEAKKWAFVSDYIRLYALYNEGGVYIDSDCELLQGIDDILENEHVVTGYASSSWLTTAFIAAEKENVWIEKLLNYYAERHFVLEDGSYDMRVNNVITTDISKGECGLKIGDSYMAYGNVRLYPRIYFQPFTRKVVNWEVADIDKIKRNFKCDKEKTICIHYGTATWVDNRETIYYKFKHLVRRITPQFLIEPIEKVYYKFHKWNEVK